MSNLWGGYNVLNNSYVHSDKHTLSMTVLNTQSPVIENFIYPWMMEAVRTTPGSNSCPIPKLNMAVKYWGANNVQAKMEGVKPDFVYYVTGLFPIKINTHSPQQAPASLAMTRNVTFAFNDFVILNSQSEALQYNLFELFVDNAVNDYVDIGASMLNNYFTKKITNM